MKANLKTELLGSGLSLMGAMYIFYAIDPLAQRVILVRLILKGAVYCMFLLGFNLWMRVNNRLQGLDPDTPAALKEHITLTLFFLAMFALMELPLFISRF